MSSTSMEEVDEKPSARATWSSFTAPTTVGTSATSWGFAPTGREVAYQYVHFLRFRDGKAVEHWSVRDDMTLMRQLGVVPERPAPVAAR